MSYNTTNDFSSTDRRGDNTYGSSNLDSTRDRDNVTGTGNYDRGVEGREGRHHDQGITGNDFSRTDNEFGRTDNLGGTGGQRDYNASSGGLGGQDRHSSAQRGGEFGRADGENYGDVRTQDRFDNTGATGGASYGSSATGTGTGTGTYGRDRTDDDNTFGARDHHGSSTTGGEYNRGNDSYGDRTSAGHRDTTTTGSTHKPTIGDKVKGTVETVTGKLTSNPAKVEHGRELKTGEIDSTNTNRQY